MSGNQLWPTRRLKFLAHIKMGQSPASEDCNDVGNGLPFLQGCAEFGAISPAAQHFCEKPPKRAEVADVLVSVRAPVGTTNVADQSYGIGRGLCAVRGLGKRFHARFCYYALQHAAADLNSVAVGSTYTAVAFEQVANLQLPAPPLDVQSAVGDFLDRKTAAVDALIASKQRLGELLQQKRDALVGLRVTRGLRPGVALKDSSVEWARQVPNHWRVMPIKRLARSGARSFTDGDWIETPFITDSGVRLIQTGNVGIGIYKEQGFRYVSEDTFAALRCTEVCPGDVLICRLDGPVGRACQAPPLGVRMITSVDNAILKLGPEHDPRYIVYLLSMPGYLEWVQGLCRVGGGFRFRISRSMLGDFRVPVPPTQEQAAIADELDRILKPIADLSKRLAESERSLLGYRQALITAAVTGQLDVVAAQPQEAA